MRTPNTDVSMDKPHPWFWASILWKKVRLIHGRLRYVGFTSWHLHQRVEEHKRATIGYHVKDEQEGDPDSIGSNFGILRKCQSKLDCLIFGILFICKLWRKLNKQSDSIHAKFLLSGFLLSVSLLFIHAAIFVCVLFLCKYFRV